MKTPIQVLSGTGCSIKSN